MSKSYKTKGIVIRRKNIGEADRFLDIYTPSLGKIHLKAKGVRRTQSKLSGHLEIFSEADLDIVTGRSIDIVTGAKIVESFKNIREDLKLTAAAYYFCELIYWLTEEGYKDTELYQILRRALGELNALNDADRKTLSLLVANVELQFLRRLGFAPELSKCVRTGAKLAAGVNYFSPAAGGVASQRTKDSLKISVPAIKVLRIMNEELVAPQRWQKIPNSVQAEVKKNIRGFVHYTLEKNLRAEGFMELMERMPE